MVQRDPGHACPCTVRAWPNNARHRVWPRPGGSCRCTKVGGTLVPRTCARAVVAPCGKACQGSAKSLHGPFWPREDQAFKNKVCKTRPPARGACRAKEARPRQEELAGMTEPKHRDPGKWSLPGRPFQAQGYFTNTRP